MIEMLLLSTVKYIDKTNRVIDCFCSVNGKLATRASWILQEMSDVHPELLIPYTDFFVEQIDGYTIDAQKRFVMRYFMKAPLPEGEENLMILLNKAFEWLLSPGESIAVRANSITVLYRISNMIPEFKHELSEAISSQLETASTGLRNRALKTLKKLTKELG